MTIKYRDQKEIERKPDWYDSVRKKVKMDCIVALCVEIKENYSQVKNSVKTEKEPENAHMLKEGLKCETHKSP